MEQMNTKNNFHDIRYNELYNNCIL